MLKKRIIITEKTKIAFYTQQLKTPILPEQLAALTQHQYAHSSVLAMTKDWNLFVEFCTSQQICPLPASSTTIRRFLEKERQRCKFSTLRRYTVTLTVIHKFLGYPDPILNTDVRVFLMSLRLEKKGDNNQADAFYSHHLDALNQLLSGSDQKRDIRDLAIYYTMFECALKRSELREMHIDQVADSESQTMIISIHQDQYQLSANASLAVRKWQALIDTDNSPYLFRSIDRHQNIALDKLNDSSIYRILRSAGERLGIHHLKFSGQSTRIGAARELHQQGKKSKKSSHLVAGTALRCHPSMSGKFTEQMQQCCGTSHLSLGINTMNKTIG
ncbi:tyrosine-type recombinase/integrase [Vibrio sp. PP-XX7]